MLSFQLLKQKLMVTINDRMYLEVPCKHIFQILNQILLHSRTFPLNAHPRAESNTQLLRLLQTAG